MLNSSFKLCCSQLLNLKFILPFGRPSVRSFALFLPIMADGNDDIDTEYSRLCEVASESAR